MEGKEAMATIDATTASLREAGDEQELKNHKPDPFAIPDELVGNQWQEWSNRLIRSLRAESRGIERVDESLRTEDLTLRGFYEIATMWFSTNLTANILTIGALGPVAFKLGSLDSMLCCFFGTAFGSAATCYMATFGPMSGNRSLVSARYTMGWWPTKLCVLLALVVILGYGMVNAVTTGIVFSAVSGGKLSSILGIVIFGLIVWSITLLGVRYVMLYERYAFIPQICVLFVLVGVAAPNFDTTLKSELVGRALVGARVSYFFTCASGPLGWGPFISDSLVYYPPSTSRLTLWSATFFGFVASKTFVQFLGIGLATGLAKNAAWAEGFQRFGLGGLIHAAYSPLGAFGDFCTVIIGLGLAANMVPGNYSAAFCMQLLSKKTQKVPRLIWNTIACAIYVVIAIPGRNRLLEIFSNFLPLIGYWIFLWITLTIEEEFIFRRRLRSLFKTEAPAPYDWTVWNDALKLPVGLAALTSFIVGWIGAILCMNQVYYLGPIARMAGPSDIGLPVAAAWGGLIYPGLRKLTMVSAVLGIEVVGSLIVLWWNLTQALQTGIQAELERVVA